MLCIADCELSSLNAKEMVSFLSPIRCLGWRPDAPCQSFYDRAPEGRVLGPAGGHCNYAEVTQVVRERAKVGDENGEGTYGRSRALFFS